MDFQDIKRDHGIGTGIKPSGTAVAGDLLNGKTAINASGPFTGNMPDNGTKTYVPGAAAVPIADGKHTGSQVASVAGLTASVVKQGSTVGGVAGTFTSDATVTAADVVNSVVAYGANGSRIVGTLTKGMPSASSNPLTVARTQSSSNNSNTTYQKIKAIQVHADSLYRVEYSFQTTSGGITAYARTYKNGVPLGSERYATTAGVPVTVDEDYYLVAGDVIELWTHGGGGNSATALYFELIMGGMPTVTLDG
jgi:hypothetical protein